MPRKNYSLEEFVDLFKDSLQQAGRVDINLPTGDLLTLISFLQFTQRGMPFGHPARLRVEELGRQFQAILVDLTKPELAEWIDLGWNEDYDVDENGNFIHQPIERPITQNRIEVHNVWTIYGRNSSETNPPLACFERPQDWGHDRWTYHRFRFNWILDDTHYINHAHCWTDLKLEKHEYPPLFAPLITQIMQPGRPPPTLWARLPGRR